MRGWQAYLESEDIDPLVQTAVMHAQFELIHPFRDGNGRIGRILIPLFLYQKKRLSTPMFYLSGYLEKNRPAYYERLAGISRDGDWNGWIEFFLEAVAAQAEENGQKAMRILALYDRTKKEVQEITRSQYTMVVTDALFNEPLFRAADFMASTGMPKNTGMTILRKLRSAGVLEEREAGRGRKSRILRFEALLEITQY